MKKIYSDDIYKKLLKNYKSPELSKNKAAELLEKYYDSSISGNLSANFVGTKLFKAISLAAMIILIPLLTLIIINSNIKIPSALTITYQQNNQTKETILNRITLETNSSETVVFETDTEVVILIEDSKLSINNGILSRLNGIDGNIYNLDFGTIQVNHDNKVLKNDFIIETDYGSFRVIGTEFKLSIDERYLILTCFEGELEFSPSDGNENISIYRNQVLKLEKTDKRISIVSQETLSTSVINLQKIKVPEFRRTSFPLKKFSSETSSIVVIEPEENENSEINIDMNLEESLEIETLLVKWEQTLVDDYKSMLFSENYLILMSSDNRIDWYDIESAAVVNKYQLDFSPEIIKSYKNILYLYYAESVTALSLTTGEILWQAPVGPIAYTTFSVNESTIAIPSADGNLYLLNRINGELKQAIDLDSGLYSSPIFVEQNIVVTTMSKQVVSINSVSLENSWIHTAENRSIGSRSIYIKEHSMVLLTDSENILFALDAESGFSIFNFSLSSELVYNPLYINGFIYLVLENKIIVINSSGDLIHEYLPDGKMLNILDAEDGSLIYTTTMGIFKLNKEFLVEELFYQEIALSSAFKKDIAVISNDNNLITYEIPGNK